MMENLHDLLIQLSDYFGNKSDINDEGGPNTEMSFQMSIDSIIEKLYVSSPAEGVDEVGKDCKHEALTDTGIGYYHCPMCNQGWKYTEWDARQKPVKNARLEERRKTISQEVKDRVDGQSRQVGGGKTLAECKEIIAKKWGYACWRTLQDDNITQIIEKYHDEAAELYATQKPQTQEGWVSVKDKLPKEGGRYLVWVNEVQSLGISEYFWNCSFNPEDNSWTDQFVHYCVTHWKGVTKP